MFVSPQILYVEILKFNMMVLRGGAFRQWLGYKGRGLTDEINTLVKEAKENTFAPLPCEGITRSLQPGNSALTWPSWRPDCKQNSGLQNSEK